MPVATMNPTVELFGFSDLLSYATDQTGLPTAEIMQAINAEARNSYFNSSLTYDEAKAQALANYLNNNGFQVQYNGNNNWSGSAFQTVAQQTTQSVIDSNVSTISRGTLRQMYGNVKEFDGSNYFMQMSRFPVSGGLGQKALYVLGSVAQAGAAVSTGISLGKAIDSTLYNAFPDFWDAHGMSTLNPETWNSITNGDDSPFAGLFNFILGLDPESGQSQMYINEDVYAYMAYYMALRGVFDNGEVKREHPSLSNLNPFYSSIMSTYARDYNDSGTLYRGTNIFAIDGNNRGYAITKPKNNIASYDLMIFYMRDASYSDDVWYAIYASSDSEFAPSSAMTINMNTGLIVSFSSYGARSTYLKDGKTAYYYVQKIKNNRVSTPNPNWLTTIGVELSISTITSYNANVFKEWAWQLVYGDYTETTTPTIEGITNQPNATLPNVSSWEDIPSTLDSLKQQYPDLWDDAMVWNDDNPTSDSMGNTSTWLPVPFPNISNMTDLQPTSGTQTQDSLQVETLPDDLLKTLTKLVQATQTQTETDTVTDTDTPPQNPDTTGDGSSPVPVAPTGEASALWSVYHPTQAQINSFGGWLWSSDFIDQLLRVFQNPMDAVVSLRKVFATPIDAGQTTIHAGFLDSEVPSAYITQQFVFVDCGSVNCYEQFGNVFDYVSTNVSLYLPFIGIVPLNTSEVMRSTLHVRYGVDMFTGACLAMVEVIRDGNTVTMYQYSGNASVEYPLSGQRASSFLGGLMSLGGAALGVATGGGSLALAGMAVGGMTQMSSVNVSHSGGFSGNAGAMGIKKPYLIIERPQTKVAQTFPKIAGYPTNYSCKLGDCKNHVVVKHVHVEGINATENELTMIKNILMDGVVISD